MSSATIQFSMFDSFHGYEVKSMKMSPPEFMQFAEEYEAMDKKDLPLVSLAVYGNNPTPRGSLKHDGNLVALTGLKIDHDQGTLTYEAALTILEKLDVKAVLHTTSSHMRKCESNPDGGPRWHILFPFRKPVRGAEDIRHINRKWVRESAMFMPSDESFNLSLGFFIGLEKGAKPMRHTYVGGEYYLDELLEYMDDAPMRPKDKPKPETEKDWVKRAQAEKAFKKLMQIDPDVMRKDWVKAIAAAKQAGVPFDRIVAWSSTGVKFQSEDDVRIRYDSFTRTNGEDLADLGSLDYLANEFPAPWGKGQSEIDEDEDYADEEDAEFKFKSPPADTVIFPPPVYIVEELIVAGQAGQLVAAGGTGKTTLMTYLAMSVATGRPFFGLEVQKGQVLYVSGEDYENEYWRVYQQTKKRMRLSPIESKEIDANFKLFEFGDPANRKHRKLLVKDNRTSLYKKGPLAKLVEKEATGYSLIVLDPLSAVGPGEENSNDAMAAVMIVARDLAKDTGAAVLVIHHMSKGALSETSQYGGRGGSAIADGSRMVMQLKSIRQPKFEMDKDTTYLMPETLRPSPEDFRDGQVLVLVNLKQTLRRLNPIPWFIHRQGFGWKAARGIPQTDSVEEPEDLELEILLQIQDGVNTISTIRNALGHPNAGPMTAAIEGMVGLGWLEKLRKPVRYVLTEEGEQALAEKRAG